MGKILLIDFMYLWNRLYYAYKAGNNPSGYYEHAKNLFVGLDKDKDYEKKFVILDGHNSCQRAKELLPDYKAGREPKTEVYKRISELIKDVLKETTTISFQRADDWEADEVIASWSKFFKDKEVFIYSGDKDLLQLMVYDNVRIGDKYTKSKPLAVIPFTDKEIAKKCETVSGGYMDDVKDILKFRVFKGDSSDKIPPAIPRLRSSVIAEIVKPWDVTKPLDPEEFVKIFDSIDDKVLLKKINDAGWSIRRNYLLMNLIHIPYKKILRETKSLH